MIPEAKSDDVDNPFKGKKQSAKKIAGDEKQKDVVDRTVEKETKQQDEESPFALPDGAEMETPFR